MLMIVAMIGALTLTSQKVQAQGGGGRPNFDPAQMKQRVLDSLKTELSVTNDDEWTILQGAIGKVLDARREVANTDRNLMRLAFAGRNRDRGGDTNNNGNQQRNRFGGAPSPEEEDLQKAIDDKVPAEELKSKLAKLREVRTDKEAKVAAAQEDLKKIISSRQEAILVINGVLK